MRYVFAILFLCFFSSLSFAQKEIKYAAVVENGWWKVIDDKGQVLVDSLAPLNTTSINEYSLKSFGGMFPFFRDGKFGFKDYMGKTIIPCLYSMVQPCKNGCVRAFDKDGRWHVINAKGKIIASSGEYEYVSDVAENGLLVVRNGEDIGCINTDGKMVIPFYYKTDIRFWREPQFEDGLLRVMVKGSSDRSDNVLGPNYWARHDYKIGFINSKGKLVIDTIYQLSHALVDSRTNVNLEGDCGRGMSMGSLKDMDALSLRADYYRFDGGLCIVMINGHNVVIDTKGDSLFSFKYSEFHDVKNFGGYIAEKSNAHGIMKYIFEPRYAIYDRDGRFLYRDTICRVNTHGRESGIFLAQLVCGDSDEETEYGCFKFIDPQNPYLSKDSFERANYFVGDYAQVLPFGRDYEDSNWVFINRKGQVLPLKEKAIDYICDFGDKELVMAHTFVDERGYTDRNFNWIIKPQFQGVDVFSEGMSAVMKDNKWGYINKKGEMIIPLKYDEATPFQTLKIK